LLLGTGAEQVGQLLAELLAREALERDAAAEPRALELGERGKQRVAAVELVGAIGAEHHQRGLAQVAGEEDEEVPRRAVSPVQVLEDEDDGARAGEALERAEERLEGAALLDVVQAPGVAGGL